MLSRVPRWGDITVECDFRNNVIYDWGHTCGYGDMRTLNYVNNYLRAGRSTTQRPPYFIVDPKVVLPASLYLDGNVMVGKPDVSRDNWKGVKADRVWQSAAPFPAPPVQTQTAEVAFDLVLKTRERTLPKRDAVDARAAARTRATAPAKSSITRTRLAAGPNTSRAILLCAAKTTASRMNGRRPAVCHSTIRGLPTPSTPTATRL